MAQIFPNSSCPLWKRYKPLLEVQKILIAVVFLQYIHICCVCLAPGKEAFPVAPVAAGSQLCGFTSCLAFLGFPVNSGAAVPFGGVCWLCDPCSASFPHSHSSCSSCFCLASSASGCGPTILLLTPKYGTFSVTPLGPLMEEAVIKLYFLPQFPKCLSL